MPVAILVLMLGGYLVYCIICGLRIDFENIFRKKLTEEERNQMFAEMTGKTPEEKEKIRKKYMRI